MNINSFPVAILGDIFHECVRSSSHRKDSVRTPIRISGICQRWRNISLSLGVLWTYLDCYVEHPRKQLIEIFDAWLHRSKGAPLNFSFECNLKHNRCPREHRRAQHVVLMLLYHQWHWGSVNFTWKFDKSPGLPDITLINMPMLKSLRLSVKLDGGSYTYNSGCVNLTRSPKLDCLRLIGSLLLEIGDEPMHLTSSVDLDLKDFTVQQCLDLLNVYPNLKNLRADFSTRRDLSYNEESYNEDRSIISHNLQVLVLQCDKASAFVVNKLVLPALEQLVYDDKSAENGCANFLAFVKRSLPPLTHLEITGQCADDDVVSHALPLLPMLEVLNLVFCIVSGSFFVLLSIPSGAGTTCCTHDEGKQIVCPNLKYLRVSYYNVAEGIRACADALCTMLESRADVLNQSNVAGPHFPLSAADYERIQNHIRTEKPIIAISTNTSITRFCMSRNL